MQERCIRNGSNLNPPTRDYSAANMKSRRRGRVGFSLRTSNPARGCWSCGQRRGDVPGCGRTGSLLLARAARISPTEAVISEGIRALWNLWIFLSLIDCFLYGYFGGQRRWSVRRKYDVLAKIFIGHDRNARGPYHYYKLERGKLHSHGGLAHQAAWTESLIYSSPKVMLASKESLNANTIDATSTAAFDILESRINQPAR